MSDTKTLYVNIQPDGNPIVAVQQGDSETFAFAGLMDKTKLFNIDATERLKKLLIRAVNNRTRERNYFKLYCEMLDGNITEEEFDKEIDENEDKYIISQEESATIEDIEMVLNICPHILGVNDPNDMIELFSFTEKSILKNIQ